MVCEPNFQKYYGFCFKSFALKPPGGRVHFVVKMGSSLLWLLQCLTTELILMSLCMIFKIIVGYDSKALLYHQPPGTKFIAAEMGKSLGSPRGVLLLGPLPACKP